MHIITTMRACVLQGKEILEFFIEDLLKSGMTYIPPYAEKDSSSNTDSAIDVSKEAVDDEKASTADIV